MAITSNPVVGFNIVEVKKQTKKQFVDSQPHLVKMGVDLESEYDKIVGKIKPDKNEGNDKRTTE